MRRVLSSGLATVELLRLCDVPRTQGLEVVGDRTAATALLRTFARDPMNMATLRGALAEEVGRGRVGRLRDAEVVAQLAAQISRGWLRLVPLAAAGAVVPSPPVDGLARVSSGVVKEAEPVVLASTPATQKAASWVKLKVVDDETGRGVAGVTFTVKLPNGMVRDYTTSANGEVSIVDLKSGTCDIEKMVDEDALEVVSIG